MRTMTTPSQPAGHPMKKKPKKGQKKPNKTKDARSSRVVWNRSRRGTCLLWRPSGGSPRAVSDAKQNTNALQNQRRSPHTKMIRRIIFYYYFLFFTFFFILHQPNEQQFNSIGSTVLFVDQNKRRSTRFCFFSFGRIEMAIRTYFFIDFRRRRRLSIGLSPKQNRSITFFFSITP